MLSLRSTSAVGILGILTGALACGSSSPAGAGGGAATTSSSSSSSSSTTGSSSSGAAADWSCIGKVSWPKPSAATVDMKFDAQTLATNLSVKVCPKSDATCAAPSDSQSSPMNMVTVKVPTGTNGFDGFFEVDGAGAPTNLKYVFPPVGAGFAGAADWQFLLFTDAIDAAIGQEIGVTLDPALAIVGLQSFDCTFNAIGGVSFELAGGGASAKLLYFVGGLSGTASLSAKATELASDALGGFVNVSPGEVTVSAKVAATGQSLGSVKVFTRAGAMTTIQFTPMP